ncbi:hypothetical protein EVA_08117 [gut metagenome]|uniref:Uncharacterized protein n=1 Tax=gut metagenome TaxID=749906 RepID=J9GN86_9ZZZZ
MGNHGINCYFHSNGLWIPMLHGLAHPWELLSCKAVIGCTKRGCLNFVFIEYTPAADHCNRDKS